MKIVFDCQTLKSELDFLHIEIGFWVLRSDL